MGGVVISDLHFMKAVRFFIAVIKPELRRKYVPTKDIKACDVVSVLWKRLCS